MNKFRTILVIIIFVTTYVFPLSLIPISYAAGPTEVSGNITSNTTWTLENSPYIVVATVQVLGGVTLTIEPGVEVKFDSTTSLNIDGELIASGESGNEIIFTSNNASPNPTDWGSIGFYINSVGASFDSNNQYLSGSIIEHAIIEYATNGVHVYHYQQGVLRVDPPYLENNNFRYNQSGIEYSWSNKFVVRDNTFLENDGYAIFAQDPSGQSIIQNNTIQNNGYQGLSLRGIDVIIDGNTIENNGETGISCSSSYSNCIITHNTITGHTDGEGHGIYASSGKITVDRNSINDNNYGVYFHDAHNDSLLKRNNIINNTLYSIYLDAESVNDIIATMNWWGTTNTSAISATIYDYFDNVLLGEVIFEPFATSVVNILGTEVSGNITEDTTWTLEDSPYIVTSTVQVFENITLTIEPGVVIKFENDGDLVIGGELIAIGTDEAMITFTSNQVSTGPSCDWRRIYFTIDSEGATFDALGNYQSGNIIQKSIIEYGQGIRSLSAVFITESILRYNRSGCNIATIGGAITNEAG